MRRRSIAIIGFGGTIAMVPDSQGTLMPARSVGEIIAFVPMLKEMADITFHELENKDSTNINPLHWTKLINKICEISRQGVDGIIVTHGTDTMAYTANAVAIALGREIRIPIVFTGSQRPLASWRSDARFNLENSAETILQACDHGIGEVMIVFNDLVLRASRAIKTSESRFCAFDSPAFPHLAVIDANGINFVPHAFRAAPTPSVVCGIQPNFHKNILVVDLVPGLEPRILHEILRSELCRAMLFRSLGAGNVPDEGEYSLIGVIESAVKTHGVPVLVSTKFIGGKTHMNVYGPGRSALEAGAIPTGDMTDVMAQVKLMWALAQGHRAPDELRRIINTNFVGEISS